MKDPFCFLDEDQPSSVRPYSGLNGKDAEALETLLSVHAPFNPSILDCTYNAGKMWKGIKDEYDVKTLDINPKYQTDYIGDFRELSNFISTQFDVLIFDPPHLSTDASSKGSSGIYSEKFGITASDNTRHDGDK